MSKKKDERQFNIRKKINEVEKIRITDLAKEFHVTTETIRKDIVEMEQQNIIEKRNGYVYLKEYSSEISIVLRNQEYYDEKKAIMMKASEFIQDRMFIYLDAGSTCQAIIPFLQEKKQITIVTNSPLIAYKCCLNNIHTLVLGGHISNLSNRTYGEFACQTMDRIHIDIAILGSLGIKNSPGFTTRESDYTLKRHIMQQSEKIMVVADHHKFNNPPSDVFAKFHEVDIFITNNLTKEQYQQVSSIKKIIQTA